MLYQTIGTRSRGTIMAGVLLGLFASSINIAVINTAIPRMVAALGGISLLPWILASYNITSTTGMPIFGKLSDIYGRKPFYLMGIVIFMAGSAMAGLSQGMEQLIVFRALQGIGGGMMSAISFAIVADIFPPQERGKWQGFSSATFGLSSVTGPLLGGWLTDNLSWRSVFYMNLPMGALAFLVLVTALPWYRLGRQRPVDYLGVATMTMAVVPLIWAFVWAGQEYPWLSVQVVGLLAVAAAMALLFILVESRASEPVLPLAVFKYRAFSVSGAAMLMQGMGWLAPPFFIPMFLQAVLGMGATNSGLLVAPMMVGAAVGSIVGGQLISRFGHYRAIAIVSLTAVSASILMLSRLQEDDSYTQTAWIMAIAGVGGGLSIPLFLVLIQNSLPQHMMGAVTGASQFFRQIGATIGLAILASAFTGRLSSEMTQQMPPSVSQQVPPALLRPLLNPTVLADPQRLEGVRQRFLLLGDEGMPLFNEAMMATRVALTLAIDHAFLIGAIFVLIALAISFFLPEPPSQEVVAPAQPQPTGSAPAYGHNPATRVSWRRLATMQGGRYRTRGVALALMLGASLSLAALTVLLGRARQRGVEPGPEESAPEAADEEPPFYPAGADRAMM